TRTYRRNATVGKAPCNDVLSATYEGNFPLSSTNRQFSVRSFDDSPRCSPVHRSTRFQARSAPVANGTLDDIGMCRPALGRRSEVPVHSSDDRTKIAEVTMQRATGIMLVAIAAAMLLSSCALRG